MDVTQKTVISLIKSALYNTKTVIPDDFDWNKFYETIQRHNIVGLAYFGFYNSGHKVPARLSIAFARHVLLLEKLWHYGNEIMEEFGKEGIDYIPLKGIKLKDLYPSPYMRSMTDVDILIREKEHRKEIERIMSSLGYTEGVESDHELHYIKDNNVIELHKRVIPSYNKDFYKVIGDGWEWVQQNPYAYVFTHFAKHYRDSGIGIKHLVDFEVMRNQATDKCLNDLHLTKFYENVQRTLDCWFRDREFDDVTMQITDTVFKSGEYGTEDNAIKSGNLKKINAEHGDAETARVKDLFGIVFPPYRTMKGRYPILGKIPVLLPFLWVWRILLSPFRGNIKKIYKNNKSITENSAAYKEELKAVGLDFWF